ncbi:unnamed protein product [Bursaphelenchus xylophilus]|uniref:LisH domain-containing protein ARMC9 n=1 Tax=Bursaphelenchus xylophilus TaxID=6326 RepID=A0A1I7RPZ7_BURXY|nr:unnamed protein product [Bursaphelenchus xylophilus]CAG9096894.1 unnamed protein product [Bursaphelenchus xylophilus]
MSDLTPEAAENAKDSHSPDGNSEDLDTKPKEINVTSVRSFLQQSAENHRNARLTIADECVSFLDEMEARAKKTSTLTPSAQLAEVARAVYQYFVRAGLHSAARELVNECEKKRIQLKIPPRHVLRGNDVDEVKKQLHLAFERGESYKFFKDWSELHPPGAQITEEIRVLEFRLHVYFATYPLRRNPPDKNDYKERIQELKEYLELGKGTQLSGNAELVQYFALPYANDPKQHPVFKELLQKTWAKNLYEDLARILNNYGRLAEIEAEEEPKIVTWLKAYERQEDPQPTSRENIKDYRALQDDFYKVIEIASELIDVLDKTTLGQTVSETHIKDISTRLIDYTQEAEKRMQKCAMAAKKITHTHPLRRNKSLNTRSDGLKKKLTGSAENLAKKSESLQNLHPADPSNSSQPHNVYPRIPIAELQFTRIANQLIKNPNSRGSALLLQALRQQITRAPSLADSNVVLLLFSGKDFLSLRNRKNSIVATICSQSESSIETKEELGRLLNALASFRNGRNYLLSIAQGKELLFQMALALRTKKLIGNAADHALACLQKLSIRSVVQKELIMSGMIEWLVSFLDQQPGNFALEFGTALLTNLCLNAVSQSTVLRLKDQLLALMLKLLKHPNIQIASYINGTLYCIFGFAKIRSTAKEMAFEQILTNKLNKCEGKDNELQLPIVIKVLKGEQESERPKKASEEEDEEVDYLEAEIESSDSLIPNMTEIFGENLLQKRYMGTIHTTTAAVSENTDLATVPGTVPHNNKGAKPPINKGKKLGKKNGIRGIVTSTNDPTSPVNEDRVLTMMSQATYVLENDKRKPLLVNCGLRHVVSQMNHTKNTTFQQPSKRSKSVNPNEPGEKKNHKVNGVNEDKVKKHKSEASLDNQDSEKNTEEVSKAVSASVLSKIEAAPITGPLQTRIPDDANVNEYTAAFGSRPKVMRTPDQQNLSNKKTDVFIY